MLYFSRLQRFSALKSCITKGGELVLFSCKSHLLNLPENTGYGNSYPTNYAKQLHFLLATWEKHLGTWRWFKRSCYTIPCSAPGFDVPTEEEKTNTDERSEFSEWECWGMYLMCVCGTEYLQSQLYAPFSSWPFTWPHSSMVRGRLLTSMFPPLHAPCSDAESESELSALGGAVSALAAVIS